jgi:glycosyltransferase involved in cell wall biosynthesis
MGVGDELRALGVRMLEIPDSVLSEEDLAGAPRASPELACDLLVVGRLDPEKGVDVLLDALPELRGADGRPVTLRVVGTGECEGRLRAKAQRLGLGSRVLFDGHVPFGPELFARYASCRLLVIPSHTEGLPKTAYEAMAFGRPVVATAVGGLRQVIGRGGERGRLVPPGDARALARAVGELLADPEALQVAGSNARAFARGVTLESQVRALVEFALPELTRERV